MKVIGVIPARFSSTRFPGKPLAKILGKPMIQWVIEGTKKSKLISEVWVATDHPEIQSVAVSSGARVAMTDPNLATGSDRVWSAVKSESFDIVVNIQGDEPLIEGKILDALVEPMLKDSSVSMATLGRMMDLEALQSSNTAKIVLNKNGEALYFSRFPIPFSKQVATEKPTGCLKHIGLYAYRKDFLQRFCEQPPVEIELLEGLEQLRALYLGAKIKVVKVDSDSWGVDTPDDVEKIEKRMRMKGYP